MSDSKEPEKPVTGASVNRVSVRWVMRFAGWGLADVIWKDRYGNVTDCVRIDGSCLNSADAKKWAKKAKTGEALPSWIRAYV